MGYLDALAALRKRKGFTQSTLAEAIGVEQPTIQRWESGKREPDLAALHQLADALGVTAGQLLDGSALAISGPRLFVKGVVAAGLWRPAIEASPDRRVIIVRTDENGQCEATVKELVERDGELWAVPRSSNPTHLPIRLSAPGPGIREVRIAAVVIASVRPE